MTKAAFFGFGWLRPEGALWALLAVLVLGLGLWAVRQRRRTLESLVARRQFARFVPGWSVNRARARYFFAAAAVFFLAFATAGPVRGFTLREVRRRGLDLVVCIDTSRSMLVRDLRPDRITRARREVRGLLDRLYGDRMALIAFAGDAREIAPLTHDRVALSSLLDSMTPAENEKGGTDLGAALERALAMFDGRTGAHECIVMLTDGEDLEARGLEVAHKAAERGVKVFVVGMGTEVGGKIPIERPGGGETFLRDSQNQEVVSAMGGKGLDEIATTTGGAYLSADSSAAPLEELYDKRISRLEARELQGGQEFVPHDRFQWFLGMAAICMLLAAGLAERRPSSRRRRGGALARKHGVSSERAGRAKPAWARALAPLFLCPALQSPPSVAPAAADAPPVPAASVPYLESPARGLAELREKLASNSLDDAHEIGLRLIAMPELADDARGEIEYHRGIVFERRAELFESSAAFARAGGLCSAGLLRLDAWYNSGTLLLEVAEQLFLQIPEVREARKLPPLAPPAAAAPPVPKSPQNSPAPKPDEDLDQALAGYLAAKEPLAQRWRADHRDADTRANLELIQRRLREIEKLREQRKQQEQEDKEKKPDPKSDEKQDQKDSADKDKSDQKPDPKQQDPKPDESQERKPDEQEQKPDPSKQDQAEKPAEQKQAQPQPAEERALSKEEISRLLDQLANIEQEAKQLEARIRARRRPPVEKDW